MHITQADALNYMNYKFCAHFKLSEREQLKDFFVENNNDVREKLNSILKRINHLIKKRVWINEDRICQWAEMHTEQKLHEFFQKMGYSKNKVEDLTRQAKLSWVLKGKAVERKILRREHGMVVPKSTFLESVRNDCKFVLEFILHPTRVGAILPSSRRLAKEIVKEIPKDLTTNKKLILEVGPGTGVFTDKIIQRMNPDDELHLVEFDPEFAELLRKKYAHIKNVKVFEGDILNHQLQDGRKYDYIVSGLPLNAFESEFVNKVFKKFVDLAKEGGKVSYFEYLAVPTIKRLFSKAQEKRNLDKILSMKKEFYRKNRLRRKNVYVNAPCARVLHHRLKHNSIAVSP